MTRFLPILFILLFVVPGFGQETTADCPTIKVSGAGVVSHGAPMTFSVELAGPGTFGKATYEWTVSAGTIVRGLGTTAITVDTVSVSHNSNVTAVVTVKGLPSGCKDTASETASAASYGDPVALDEYERLSWSDEQERLDNMLIQLSENRKTRLLMLMEIKTRESFPKARMHATKIIRYFAKREKAFDPTRVGFIIYARDRHSTQVYLLPDGAEIPEDCNPPCLHLSGAELVKE